MERSQLPSSAFIDPQGTNREQVALLVKQALDLILSHASTANERSPLPESSINSDSINIPYAPASEQEILDKLHSALANSMNPAHAGYIGHMDTIPTTMSILGDLAAAAANNNMLSLEMSPVFSRIEHSLVKQVAALFGLGENAGGIMLSGGSLANLQALTVARNSCFESLEKGITSLQRQPLLFASEVAHTSIQKAAMLLGLGTSSVIKIAVNADSQMDVADLQQKIAQAKAEDKAPFCVVAMAGTTTTGNIDPLSEIHRIASKHSLWFHVDASYGGAVIFSEKYKYLLAGIEHADSITFNPQKWLYIAKTCAMALFKDVRLLQNAFRVHAPYMRNTETFTNIGEISVQGTHHADVLKFWLSLQHIGQSGYAQLIEESYKLTSYLVQQVERRPFLQIANKPEMNLVCFRGTLDWIPQTDWDNWNARLQTYLLHEGHVFLSLPLYREARWLRAVLLNPYTNEVTIDTMFKHIDIFAASV